MLALGLLLEASAQVGSPGVKPPEVGSSASQPASSERAPLAAPDLSAPWRSFRGGPELQGRRAGQIAEKPRLQWSRDLETRVESTAAVVAGRLYVGTDDAGLIAFDLELVDGKPHERWRHPADNPISASPAVEGGKVLVGDRSGVFHCIDAETGKLLWKHEPEDRQEIASSATVVGDRVLYGDYDARLYCVGLADGKLLWSAQAEGPLHATPAVSEGRAYIAGCDAMLRAVSLADGKEVAALEMGEYSAASPAIEGGRLVVGTFGAQVLGVDLAAGKVSWRFEAEERKLPYYASPALGAIASKDGPARRVAVVAGRDKLVRALDLDTGKALWQLETRAKVDASPVIVGSRVIVAGLDGELRILDLADGREVWKFTSGGAFLASPAVGEGRLVIATDEGVLHVFDLRPEAP